MRIKHQPGFNPRAKQLITIDELKAIAPSATDHRIESIYPFLLNALDRYEINTPLRIAHFLAQVIHESGSFRYMEEIASGEAYEDRADLGNIHRGDGKRFKGRGLIQLTGRENYELYSEELATRKELYPDITRNPEKVAHDPGLAVDVAGWFWNRKNLNALADNDDITAITKRVNGGLNGFADRKKHLSLAKSILT